MKKLILAVIIAMNFLPFYAQADMFDLGNPTEVASDMLQQVLGDLGVDEDELENQIQTMNVARRKKQAPQVSLDFSPANPVQGGKITAVAKPIYFLNDASRLYYTWYLKHKNCVRAKKGDSDFDPKCDLDKSNEVDIEDWKIEAARIIASNDFDWAKADYSSDRDNDGYDAFLGGDDQQGKDPDPQSHCYIHDFKTGDDFNMPREDCHHLFPNAPDEETGDDSFGASEEKFWRTDPQNSDTANTGKLDEANVSGMGISEFTWNYQNDDKIGLAVEGISMDPTQATNASYKIMWAILKNDLCDSVNNPLDDARDSLTGLTNGTTTVVSDPVITTDPVTDHVTTVEVTTVTTTDVDFINFTGTVTTAITTTTTVEDEFDNIISGPTSVTTTSTRDIESEADSDDLNACLENNLISPTEGGQSQKIDVSLSYLPASPINDPAGENAIEIVVNSSITNANDPTFLKYVWQVYRSNVVSPDSWGNPVLKSDLPGIGQTIGSGLSSLKFKPQFSEPAPKFLKIKLTVTENGSTNTKREGHSDVIIPLSLTSNKISVFPVTVSPKLVLSLGTVERCATGTDKAICPIVPNEIIGMSVVKGKLKNFVWTINGDPVKPISYPLAGGEDCLSGECDPATSANTNIAYFSVLKEKGFQYNVSMTAEDDNGEKVTLTKNFEVVDPEIKILSSDFKTCQPVLLGNYVDFDNKQWPDYSDTNFLATPGTAISLKPVFNNSYITEFIWYIDGVRMNGDNLAAFGATVAKDGTLTFSAAKRLEEIYNVSVQALYAQDNNTKKFLNQNAGVQFNEFLEMTISDNIEIQMADLTGNNSAAQTSAPRKFLAALFTGLPVYANFLFRIALTVTLILAVSWITMAFTPKAQEK